MKKKEWERTIKDNVSEKNVSIHSFIAKLISNGFKKTIDSIDSLCQIGAPIYYKLLSNKEYLICSHHIYEKGKYKYDIEMLDFIIAEYENEYEIGKKQPKTKRRIIYDFNPNSDIELLHPYIDIVNPKETILDFRNKSIKEILNINKFNNQ